jgi:hypothetical protein
MKRTKKSLAVALMLALMSACATIQDLHPGEGPSFSVRGKTYEQVWTAAVTVASKNLEIIQKDKEAGAIRAEKFGGAWTFGQVVGIFISPVSETSPVYTVQVVSKERYRFQFGTKNWESTIIEGMKAELAASNY